MHILLVAVIGFLLATVTGCSLFDPSYDSAQGVVERSMQEKIWLNGAATGTSVRSGISINDALVVSYGADMMKLWDLRIAQFNGASVGAAITQASISAAITGIAVNQGSAAAMGGLAAASLFLQQMFGIANTPAKANAYLTGKDLLVAAENEYWLSLRVDSCGETKVSGTELTDSGAQYLVRINNSSLVVQKALQFTIPTLEQMQAATVPADAMKARRQLLDGSFCVRDDDGKIRRSILKKEK